MEKQKLQNAVDASALAAAQDLPDTTKATATADSYIQKNGYSPSDITISFPNNSTVNISGSKRVDYSFAKFLGFQNKTVTPTCSVTSSSINTAPFDYSVFAGEGSASFNGSRHIFGNGVYGRDGVSLGNKAQVLHGNAVSSNSTCGPSTITFGDGRIITNNPVISMPDLSELIHSQGIVCSGQSDFDSKFSGKSLTGPVYVNGNLTISGKVSGTGIIYATGTINYTSAQSSSDSIVFYAGGTGGLTYNGGTGNIYGVLYAPNGTITVNGGVNGIIYGRIISKNITVNGSKFSVYPGTNDLKGLHTIKNVIKLTK